MGIFLIAIILLVLVLSILFGGSLDKLMGITSSTEEGFISYNVSGAIGADIVLPAYSKTPITKLYDNIYVDKSNGYLIGITGPTDVVVGASGEEMDISDDITSIRVYPRTSSPTDYAFTSSLEIIKTADSSTTVSNTQFLADFTSGSSKYTAIYVAMDTTTYIHIVDRSDITNLKDLETFKVSSSGITRKTQNAEISITDVRTNTGYVVMADDGSYIESTRVIYSRPVQKLGGKFYYDLSSGAVSQVYLVGPQFRDSYVEVTVRPKTDAAGFSTKKVANVIPPADLGSIESISYTTKLYEDDFMRMVQIVDGKNSAFILYYLVNGEIKLHSVYRYKDKESTQKVNTINNMGNQQLSLEQLTQFFLKIMGEYNKNVGVGGKGSGSGIDDISSSEEYAKWLAYWNTEAGKTTDANMSDYTLKTMIVPPVCPSCPSCPGNGASCKNCGTDRSDASGSSGGSGSSGAGISAEDSELTRLAASTGRGVKELAKETVGGATGLARETVGGATGLARETVGGTVGLARETVGGAVGLAKETVGGALGLVREAGGEVKGLFSGFGPTQVRDIQMGGQSQGQGQYGSSPQAGGFGAGMGGGFSVPTRGSAYAGSDPYSYNGSLVSKGGNFMPITADFSRFGR